MTATSHCGFGFLTALDCNRFVSAGALPRTPLGKLRALSRRRSWFKEALLLRRRGGKKSEGRTTEKNR